MADDQVSVQVYHGHYKMMPLAEALLAGAVRSGKKTWPSGVTEDIYRMPRFAKKKRDDGRRGLGGGRSFLTQRERKSLQTYIGVPVESAQDARREMAKRGLRQTEKGEQADEVFDRMQSGDAPQLSEMDLWGDEAKRKPFGKAEFHEAYQRNLARFRAGELKPDG